MNDLRVFEPATLTWTDISVPAAGFVPAPRSSHGFTAVRGRLYVHGGYGKSGMHPMDRFPR